MYTSFYEKTKEKILLRTSKLMTYFEKRAYPRLGGLLDHNIIQSIQKEVGVQVNLLTYQSLASTV